MLFTLPAGRLGRSAPAAPDPDRRRPRARRAPREHPDRLRPRRAHARRSSTSSGSSSGRAPSSSTSRTSRTCPRSSSATRSSMATPSSRSAVPRRRSRGPGFGGPPRPGPHCPVRDPRRLGQLPRVGSLHPRHPQARADARSPTRSTARAELVDRAEGGAPLRPLQPEPARPGGLHRHLELLLERRVRDHHRLPRPRRSASRPGVIGLTLSLGSIGSLVAALTATRISGRFGIGPTTIASVCALRRRPPF